jgi:hypothetical protein
VVGAVLKKGIVQFDDRRTSKQSMTLGLPARWKRLSHPAPREEAARLAAIRAIVEMADTGEDHDIVAEALLSLGASQQKIVTAMLDD